MTHSRVKGAKKYDATAWSEFLKRIGEGRSARDICQNDKDMPAWRLVSDKLNSEPEFAMCYSLAMENRGQVYADKISELVERVVTGDIDPNAARVAIDALKWTSSKLAPKRFGDIHRMEVKHESSYVDALKSVAERIDGDGDVSVIEGVKQATDTLHARDNQNSVNKETMQ
jgi:hypothetical protein